MTDNLLASINIVLPMFVYGLVGFATRRTGLVPEQAFAGLSKLYLNALLPCTLFVSVANLSREPISARMFLYLLGVIVVTLAACLIIVPRLEKRAEDRGVIMQALLRGNTAVYGIPLAQGLVGSDDIGDIALLLGAAIVVYNLVAPLLYRDVGGRKSSLAGMLKSIVTNPLLIAEALGGLWLLSGWQLPQFADTALRSMGAAATPLAFICIGASFSLKAAAKDRGRIALVSAVRLVAAPLLWVTLAVCALGFNAHETAGVLAVAATPCAVCTFPMAKVYGANAELAGELVVMETALSVITLFLFIFALKTLGAV